jgi:hypothetical protein
MKSPWWKRLLRTGLVLILLGMAAFAIFWYKLPAVLTWGSNYWLHSHGFEDSQIVITKAGSTELLIKTVKISGAGWMVQLNKLIVSYELKELWDTKELKYVRLSDIDVLVDQDALPKPDSTEPSLTIDPAWFSYLPKEGVEITDFNFNWITGRESFSAAGTASLSPTETDAFLLDLGLEFKQLKTHLSGLMSPDFPLELSIQTETPDLLATLESALPEWRSQFQIPGDLEITAGGIKADIQLTLDSLASLEAIQTRTRLQFEPVELNLGDRRIRLFTSELDITSSGTDHLTGIWQAELKEAQVKAFRLGPQSLTINFSTEDLKDWTFSTEHPLAWEYDEETAAGASGFSGRIETADVLKLSGTVSTTQLSLSELQIAPLTTEIQFENDTLNCQVSELSLQEYQSVQVTEVTGSVTLNADDTIGATFQGNLAPNALSTLLPESRLAPFAVNLDTTISDETLSIHLGLQSPPSRELLFIPDRVTATGALQTQIEAIRPLEGLHWTGKLSSEISGLKAEGRSWKTDEGSLTTSLQFKNLNQKIYLEDNQTLLEELTKSIQGNLQGTANQLTAGPLTAQWIYSELKFGPHKESPLLQAQLSLTAGSLNAGGETLNQMATEISSIGNPDHLETSGSVSFQFQGIEGKLNFNQSVEDLLSRPSVKGEFTLQPMQFDYSDLISKYVPAVGDLIFSGKLSAGGTFEHDRNITDASAEILFEDGSIDLPSSELKSTGVNAALSLASITRMKGEPGKSFLTVGQTQVGDLLLSESEVRFDFADRNNLYIESADTHMFGGEISMAPANASLDPLSVSSTVKFDRLSLKSITEMISVFKGSMEGAVSGQIPLSFKNGRFVAGEGHLNLANGEKARLKYDAKGLFAKRETPGKNVKPTMADRLMNQLKLQPESVVENVLSDLTINDLSIELLPNDTPLTPIRIRFSGEGHSGETRVPLTLDTNVNGTLNELLDFLLQINSLGSPVLQ